MSLMNANDLNFASLSPDGMKQMSMDLPSIMNVGGGSNGMGMDLSGMDSLTKALQGTGKLGFNIPTIGLGLNALSSLVGGIAAFKQLGLANKQFDFTKKTTEANMANQIKTYNTSLADRARSRAAVEGQSQAQADEYVKTNSLTKAY